MALPPGLPVLGGIGAAAVAGWGVIKGYLSRVYGLFVVRITLNSLSAAMLVYLKRNAKTTDLTPRTYNSSSWYVRPMKCNQLVTVHVPATETTLYRLGWRFMLVSEEGKNISFIRGMFKREKLVLELTDLWNRMNKLDDTPNSRFFIRRFFGSIGEVRESNSFGDMKAVAEEAVPGLSRSDSGIDIKYCYNILGWTENELGQPIVETVIKRLSLNDNMLDAIESARRWKASREWYLDRGIPWKRGWLLYGPPGTGKTAVVRAMAQDLNMPVFMFDLATMNNSDLSRFWSKALSSTPCITLFEDIDGVFHGRENIAVKGMQNGVTFNGFLNIIDGVENTDGVFIIVTTNTLEHIDSAIGIPANGDTISTRPGRIDRAIELGMIDYDGMIKMATRIFEGFERPVWEDLLHPEHEHTPAQFQEICCQRALLLYWESHEKEDE